MADFLIPLKAVKGGEKMACNGKNFLLMCPVFPFVFPFMTHPIHSRSRRPRQSKARDSYDVSGDTRTRKGEVHLKILLFFAKKERNIHHHTVKSWSAYAEPPKVSGEPYGSHIFTAADLQVGLQATLTP